MDLNMPFLGRHRTSWHSDYFLLLEVNSGAAQALLPRTRPDITTKPTHSRASIIPPVVRVAPIILELDWKS